MAPFSRRSANRRRSPQMFERFQTTLLAAALTASSNQPVKLSRPLDFLVVADHSDNMGFFPDLLSGKSELLANPTGRKWYEMIQSGNAQQAAIEMIQAFSQGTFPKGSHVRPRQPLVPGGVAADDRRRGGVQRARSPRRVHNRRYAGVFRRLAD